jgi:hypothetical protein
LKQREVEDWRIRYSNSENALEKLKDVQLQSIHLNNQLSDAENELDKLHELLEKKVDELE